MTITPEIITAIFGSSVLASLLTAIFAKFKKDKSILIDNIVKERKAWRTKVRNIVQEVEHCHQIKNGAGIKNLEAQLTVVLNPSDEEDLEILKVLSKLKKEWKLSDLEIFNRRVAYLLKHDWERVKKETSGFFSPQILVLASLWVSVYYAMVGDFIQSNPSISVISFGIALFFIFPILLGSIISAIKNRSENSPKIQLFLCWLENKAYRKPYEILEKSKKEK